MSAASSIAVPAPSWVVIAPIASSTMSNSAHAPGSTHAVRTDEERSVLMLSSSTRSPVLSAAYSTLPAVSLTYTMSPLPPLTSRSIVPKRVLYSSVIVPVNFCSSGAQTSVPFPSLAR